MKQIRILFLILSLTFVMTPQARAIDPITLGILAPIALRAAQAASPYVVRGLANLARSSGWIFKDTFRTLYLPVGILQMLFMWPWGYFRRGLINFFRGLISPFKMVLHSLLLPLYLFGVKTNF